MKTRASFLVAIIALVSGAHAQSNKGGTVHLCVGYSLGVFNTHYDSQYTIPGTTIGFTGSEDGTAATSTFPFEVHVGLIDLLSLGLYVEPGSYLDSSDTQTNSTISVGLSPRIYIVNKDRFNWTGILDVGVSGLKIYDEDLTGKYNNSYAGGHFRIGTGVTFYLGNHLGIQLNAKYGMYNMKWRDREPNGADGYSGTLTVNGFHIGGGLTFRLGK